METKVFKQVGTFSLLVLGAFFIITGIMAVLMKPEDGVVDFVLIMVMITLGICLLTFYKLTIIIDDINLSFKLGIGLFSRKYKLSDIKECRAVKNNPLTGIGIRLYSKGWLYNVSGLGAIELTFSNKASRVRIGTDRPEEVAAYVNSKLGFGTPSSPEPFNVKAGYSMAVIVILALFAPVIILLSGRRETKADAGNDSLILSGIYGITINYAEIISVDTLTDLPDIKRRTNGYSLGGVLKGNFRLADGEDVKLFVETSSHPFILIKTTNVKPVYISLREPRETRALFSILSKKVHKN
jgi:hypothetical protein